MSGVDRKKAIIPRVSYLVKRYHTVPTLIPETIGHHSANVALLCDIIYEGEASKNLMMAALLHDLPEQWTGDMPAPAKVNNPELADKLGEAEEYWWENVWGEQPPELDQEEFLVLKAADTLDLCFKCSEEMNMGNMALAPVLINGFNYVSAVPLQGRYKDIVNDIVMGIKATVGIKDEPTIITNH